MLNITRYYGSHSRLSMVNEKDVEVISLEKFNVISNKIDDLNMNNKNT